MRITPSRPSHLWFWLFPSETLHRFASLGLKSRITAHLWAFPGKTLHRFASLGLKSRIDAHLWAFPGKTLQRFASLGLKSRIDAHLRAFPRKSLHRFPSLALKSRIAAHLRAFPSKTLQRFPSLALKSRIEAVQARSAGETILFAATKISIGREIPLQPRQLQAKPFSLPLRKLESDAEDRCSHGSCRRNHFLCRYEN